MYIKLLINVIFRTSLLVSSVTGLQEVLISLIRQLQLLLMKECLCQFPTVFIHGSYKQSPNQLNEFIAWQTLQTVLIQLL